jgi:hypothetical protein
MAWVSSRLDHLQQLNFNKSNIKARIEYGEFGDKAIADDSGYPRKTYLRNPTIF